jgi:hypothetical protein
MNTGPLADITVLEKGLELSNHVYEYTVVVL